MATRALTRTDRRETLAVGQQIDGRQGSATWYATTRSAEGRLVVCLDYGDHRTRVEWSSLVRDALSRRRPPAPDAFDEHPAPMLAELPEERRAAIAKRYRDLLHIKYGSPRGDAEGDRRAGMLNPAYDPLTTSLPQRVQAKQRELRALGEDRIAKATIYRQLERVDEGPDFLIHGNRRTVSQRLDDYDPLVLEIVRAEVDAEQKRPRKSQRKLLARIWKDKALPLAVRTEAVFHMTPHFAYPLMLFLSAFLLPMLIVMPASDPRSLLLVDFPLFFGSTGSVVMFYVTADVAQGRSVWDALKRLPSLMALGCGMSPYLTKAVAQGLGGPTGEFVRTPKKGEKSAKAQRYHARTQLPMLEMLLSLENAVAIGVAIQTKHYAAAPFALLFSFGYAWVSSLVIRERLASERAAARRVLVVKPASELGEEGEPVLAGEGASASSGDSLAA